MTDTTKTEQYSATRADLGTEERSDGRAGTGVTNDTAPIGREEGGSEDNAGRHGGRQTGAAPKSSRRHTETGRSASSHKGAYPDGHMGRRIGVRAIVAHKGTAAGRGPG